jgi:hypothetical protein
MLARYLSRPAGGGRWTKWWRRRVAAWHGRGPGVGLSAGPLIALLDAAPVLAVTAMSTALGLLTTAWHHWWWGRNAILATEERLVARTRGREVLAYRWSEIDRASWSDGFRAGRRRPPGPAVPAFSSRPTVPPTRCQDRTTPSGSARCHLRCRGTGVLSGTTR